MMKEIATKKKVHPGGEMVIEMMRELYERHFYSFGNIKLINLTFHLAHLEKTCRIYRICVV